MLQVSKDFKNAILVCGVPQYRLALQVGCHPVTLNRLLTGYQPIKGTDLRLIKIARFLKFPEDRIFESEKEKRVS
jgi:hypothetical protein